MIEINDNIWIKGFSNLAQCYDFILSIGGEENVIYKGRRDHISKKILEEVLKVHPYSCMPNLRCYFEYDNPDVDIKNTTTEIPIGSQRSRNDYLYYPEISIYTACKEDYCVIFKK